MPAMHHLSQLVPSDDAAPDIVMRSVPPPPLQLLEGVDPFLIKFGIILRCQHNVSVGNNNMAVAQSF
jgi:hypothetical protein